MITESALIEEARQLVVWYKQPSGYQAADTEIGPKVDRAFKLLDLCADILADPRSNASGDGQVWIGPNGQGLKATPAAPALPPNRIEVYGATPAAVLCAICVAVDKAYPGSFIDTDLTAKRGALMVIVMEKTP